jgi:hypothetical protein
VAWPGLAPPYTRQPQQPPLNGLYRVLQGSQNTSGRFPPHSTHMLQPLDVVCFKLLSTSYSTKLSNYLFKTQALLAVQKEDFFPLFWSAWEPSLTTKLVCKTFKAIGICPMNADFVVQRFSNKVVMS